MANSPNERPPSAGPPSTEEAERLAERFRPSWELEAEPHADPVAGGGPAARAGNPEGAPVPSPAPVPPVAVARMKQTLVGMNPFLGSVATSEPPPPPNVVSTPPSNSAAEMPQLEVRPARLRSMTLLGVAPPGAVERPDPAATHAAPAGLPPAEQPAAAPEPSPAPPAATMKGTLVGVPVPEPVPRATAPIASEREEIIWEVGVEAERAAEAHPPATPHAAAEAHPPATPHAAAEAAPLVALGAQEDAAAATQSTSTDVDVIEVASISDSASQAAAAAPLPAQSVVEEEPRIDLSKPSGVARPYEPKQDPSTPAIVVDQSVLHAGQEAAAAQASARRARTLYSKHSATVPGNVRVVPRGPGQTPRIEVVTPDDALPDAGSKAKTPLLLALIAVLIAVGVLVLFTSNKPSVTQEPLPTAPTAPATTAARAQDPPPPALAPTREKAAEPVQPREPAVTAPEKRAPEVSAPAPAAKAAPRVVRRQPSPPPRPPRKQQPAAKRPAAATPAPATKPKAGVIVRESPF